MQWTNHEPAGLLRLYFGQPESPEICPNALAYSFPIATSHTPTRSACHIFRSPPAPNFMPPPCSGHAASKSYPCRIPTCGMDNIRSLGSESGIAIMPPPLHSSVTPGSALLHLAYTLESPLRCLLFGKGLFPRLRCAPPGVAHAAAPLRGCPETRDFQPRGVPSEHPQRFGN